MNRKLTLLLPLALLAAACSNTPAPSAGDDDHAPAPAATQPALADLNAQHLEGQYWRLSEAADADGKRLEALFVEGQPPLSLTFRGDRFGLLNLCNSASGRYALKDGEITFEQPMQTLIGCMDARGEQEEAAKRALVGTSKVELAGDGPLTLRNARGDVLVFAPEPTAETRYGGEGETVFIEVAAQTKPCPHPLIRDKQCLQTRQLRYDDNGIKQGSDGAFEHFYDDIEGYSHEDGVRNVLRVKRYTIANPPADGSSNAWVLDMVVESETVK